MSKNISNTILPASVYKPSFDRSLLKSRIVHLGFGAFHRAHQALYTNDMLEKTKSDWGICEISLFGVDLIKKLRTQDHLYSVLEKGTETVTTKINASIVESLHPKLDGIQNVLNKMAEPQVAIVSLTITEKGYCADLTTGRLDINHPLIQEDLQSPETPKSAIGFIVQALKLRKELKLNGFTVMSCDNVPNNSRVAQQVVLDYANLLDPELEAWIKENTRFPCTMVDRIVPAITEESFAELKDRLSIDDPCGIVCESFSQWVIEDDFIEGRPEWDVAGATFVDDVRPFEDMKLRLLNGSHSFLAYLGYLSGYKYIYQTMQDDAFKKATLALMLDEQAMTLSMPKGIDITEYSKSLIDRFSNANIKHETGQIAADGSQKLPQRFCESLRFLLDQERMPIWILLGIAGWMLYVSEEDEQGEKIIVKDPLLDQIREAYKNSQTTKDLVFSLLGIKAIFGEDLIQHKVFVDSLIDKLEQLRAIGAKSTVFENQ